ncbi:DUF7288 family protein [Halosolutus gelatinilyticus]|uniref:DUF7288 family protein n=1 Tax=Halosolutus gelatinilyticus TaxID=2931975 RepID=UPI001FF662A2|nr:hypothetical protein [Halosolutus gelatinilyticus]
MLDRTVQTERAQAYTLEGFIGAMILLLAVLFALQAVVITPTTGGLADRTVKAQLQQESQDALTVSSQDGNLSETIRNWNESDGAFYNATEPASGQDEKTYTASEFANQSRLGAILHDRYTNDGWSYNVELVSYNDSVDGFESTYMVYQGSPPSDAFTASHVVTLYEDDLLTRPNESGAKPTLAETTEYPISQRSSGDSGVYNLVEVRVILW